MSLEGDSTPYIPNNVTHNAVLIFDPGHPFIKTVLDMFLREFRPGVFGSGGPTLTSSVHDFLSNTSYRFTYQRLEPRLLFVSALEVHKQFSVLIPKK